MILKSLYIDNYKSFVNFKIEFGAINLLLGENGSGKSTTLEVLLKLRALLIKKQPIESLFSAQDLTRWQISPLQRFELTIATSEGVYQYELLIEHERTKGLLRIQREILSLEQQLLLSFEGGTAQLYRDNGTKGPEYPFDWSMSAVASLPERGDNTKLTHFKRQIEKLVIFQPNPVQIEFQSASEEKILGRYGENFVSWYRYLSLDQGFLSVLNADLKEILSDFASLSFEEVGQSERILVATFRQSGGSRVHFNFDELSDGQRMLIMLYTCLRLPQHRDFEMYKLMLCLDEPENFIALREIQPWLRALYDQAQDQDLQTILISHHPEVIDYLLIPEVTQIGYWFERSNLSPTRIFPIKTQPDHTGLSLSELIARSWIDET